MANPEHVQIVKRGAEAIAEWRLANPGIRFDLYKANLIDCNLCGADLFCAVLNSANLRYSNMVRANLGRAHLVGASLIGTELRDADMRGADLSGTSLSGADLRGADLSGANLSSADLNAVNLANAVLSGAQFGHTAIVNTSLVDAKGLETVTHKMPSTIGVDTLFMSQGSIPEAFLRGCGVPDELIVQLPAIIGTMQPIEFYSCFISYSSDDDAFARRLHVRLRAEKLRVWFAPEDMKGGKKVAEQIDTAIRGHDRLLLVLSEKSMESKWVLREIERAREKEKQSGRDVVFPIALVPYETIRAWECLDVDSGEDLAKKVREYHIPDFSQWKQGDEFEKAFGDLMRDLRAKAERGR